MNKYEVGDIVDISPENFNWNKTVVITKIEYSSVGKQIYAINKQGREDWFCEAAIKGLISKSFVLPEKWCILKNKQEICDWFGRIGDSVMTTIFIFQDHQIKDLINIFVMVIQKLHLNNLKNTYLNKIV